MNHFTKHGQQTPASHTGNRAAGFTLTELMVVIALIAILIGLATPAMARYLQERGVREAAEQLAMDMQRAKLLAISRNAPCTITFDTANNTYTISLINQTVDLANYRGGVTFAAPLPAITQITYMPQGICSAGITLFLTNAQGTLTLGLRTTIAGGISQI